MANPPPVPNPDGPPPYRLFGEARFDMWRTVDRPEWLSWEIWLWISGLFWDPWQHPSVRSEPPGPGQDEVRSAEVPDTRVGISYLVAPKAKMICLIEVADLP